ncbi:MAG: UDP-N-acetylglucosamine 2-epimerase [Lentisphaerae bacterium RIFOXYB12_FULL_65_16]|nr:MAG: UDP-N-acetylglucosamine 2-epimerase [Lentisphaerae bacterium RIFOXYA12_64_32]OGV85509.1 MAG: UDP-N-acetylglucosamine 2-epimerase [Lentisphaerae bacterium RIFOXYB12_FULL_65_16]
MKIINVVGARPNFMKIAPLLRAYQAHPGLEPLLVHTGQHYDRDMSDRFFDELGIPPPDMHLGIGSGTHAEQVGRTMIEFEKVVREHRPDWVVVVGDVNATCACAITAKKERVKLAHVEAGLRSFDMTMPEEINRLVTDRLSDLLFTPDAIADANLRREGVPEDRIKQVGNIMIDTLIRHRARAAALDLHALAASNLADPAGAGQLPRLQDGGYTVLTLHRPSNVDDGAVLQRLAEFFALEVARDMPVLWPLHPRTRKRLDDLGLAAQLREAPGLVLLNPLGYLEMLRLNLGARVMFTDSGGLQEECCVLGTPCLTLRANTERPITLVEHGGLSVLVGNDVARIRGAYHDARGMARKPVQPPLWDGHTAERIAAALQGEAQNY